MKLLFAFWTMVFCLIVSACGVSESDSTQNETSNETLENPSTVSEENVTNEKENQSYIEANDESNPLMSNESFKRVIAFLPAQANGVKGGPAEGWVKAANGPGYTFAKRSYRNLQNKSRLDLGIADAGSETLESLNMIKYWNNKKIDEKTAKGHERTLTYKSFPAFEKCVGTGCDISFAVDNRFLISAYINKVELEDKFSVFEGIDINQLRQLSK